MCIRDRGNLDDLITEFKDFPNVVRVLEIRKLLSKTSTAKYLKMKDTACSDGRSRGNLQFYGATHTGRWAGRLIQVQNLPQNHISDLDIARRLVKNGDLEALEMAYGNSPDILSQCLRTAIIPDEGKKFLVADFSAIEARVTAWFANETWRLDAFKEGKDIYCMSASKMFGVPVEKHGVNGHLRQKGKVAELACGFQGSFGALRAMGGEKMGLSDYEMKEIVDSWRRESPNIRDFWYESQNACINAIKNISEVKFGYGRLKAKYIGGWLFITLPSGRSLSYAKAKIIEGTWGQEQIGYCDRASAGNSWIDRNIYGGKIVENIVQATARDCLAITMLRLHEAGYKIVMHVHDEVIIEIDESEDKLNDVLEIMSEEISWAVGLPLTADGYECMYYQKD